MSLLQVLIDAAISPENFWWSIQLTTLYVIGALLVPHLYLYEDDKNQNHLKYLYHEAINWLRKIPNQKIRKIPSILYWFIMGIMLWSLIAVVFIFITIIVWPLGLWCAWLHHRDKYEDTEIA